MHMVWAPEVSPHLLFAVLGSFAAWVMAYQYRAHARRAPILLYWTWSWWALSMAHLCMLFPALVRTFALSARSAAVWPALQWAGLILHGVTLLLGCWAFARPHRDLRMSVGLILGGLVVLGASARYMIGITVQDPWRILTIDAVGQVLWTGGVYLISGAWLFLYRQATRARAVMHMLILALGSIGLAEWVLGAVRQTAMATSLSTIHLTVWINLFLYGILLPAMVLWTQEHERLETLHAMEQARRKASFFAYHDPVTYLPNSRMLLEELHIRIESSHERRFRTLTVVWIELSEFSDLQMSLGPAQADFLMRMIAARIQHHLPAHAFVARYQPHVFVWLPEHSQETPLLEVIENLAHHLSRPFRVGEESIPVRFRLGVSHFPRHGRTPEDLLNAAMVAARESQARIAPDIRYASDPATRAPSPVLTESWVQQAFDRQQFVTVYQPIVRVANRQIVGFEALARLHHPQKGILTPQTFLHTIHRLGMEIDFDRWMIRAALAQLAQWQHRWSNLTLSVNVSPQTLQHPEFPAWLRAWLEEFDVRPDRLNLEITESQALSNMADVTWILRELKHLGVSVTIDDFGTGYSSINYLRLLPIDRVKLDRSFVTRIPHHRTDASVAAAIIILAHLLSIDVVAEGVEHPEQLRWLQDNGCDYAQGFYIARPLAVYEAEALLHAAAHTDFRMPIPEDVPSSG